MKKQRAEKKESKRRSGREPGTDAVRSLLAADAAWLEAYQAKDETRAAGFYDEDGAMLAPNRPLLAGRKAIAEFIEKSFEMKEYHIHWHANKAEVARSGELGYTSGVYEMSFRKASGKLFLDKGKYLMLWKRKAAGEWKVIFDISNSDLPQDTAA
jgi:ketosteroid isomerase-like protein